VNDLGSGDLGAERGYKGPFQLYCRAGIYTLGPRKASSVRHIQDVEGARRNALLEPFRNVFGAEQPEAWRGYATARLGHSYAVRLSEVGPYGVIEVLAVSVEKPDNDPWRVTIREPDEDPRIELEYRLQTNGQRTF
jgi:hypothetical protein